MAWRRRRSGLSIGRTVAAVKRALARSRKTKRLYRDAAFGRRFRGYLRSRGIKRGQPYATIAYNMDDAIATQNLPSNYGRIRNWRRLNDEERQFRRDTGAYIGRGAYSLGKAWRAVVGKKAGRALRDAVVNKAVSQINGSGMYSGRGLYSGRGSYSSNNLIEGGRPSMSVVGSGDETQGLVITHKEFLQDVYGPAGSGFSIEGWQLNPSLAENFPWLSQMAMNYEEYEFIQLVFEFRSTIDASSVNNPAGNTGSILMATNYNPTAPLFSSKEQMMQYHGCSSGRLTQDLGHGVECDPSKNAGSAQKYTRTAPVLPDQDIKTFDLGLFQIAMTNVPSAFQNQQVGELWVYYKVRLDKPRLFSNLGMGIAENRYVSCGGETAALIMGTNILSMQQNVLPISLVNTSNNLTITFPDFFTGLVELQVFIEGTSFSGGSRVFNAVSFTGNVGSYNDLYASSVSAGDTPSYIVQAVSGTSEVGIMRLNIAPTTTGVDNAVIITTSVTATTVTQTQVIIRVCNPAVATSRAINVPTYVNSVGVVTSPICP